MLVVSLLLTHEFNPTDKIIYKNFFAVLFPDIIKKIEKKTL